MFLVKFSIRDDLKEGVYMRISSNYKEFDSVEDMVQWLFGAANTIKSYEMFEMTKYVGKVEPEKEEEVRLRFTDMGRQTGMSMRGDSGGISLNV